MYSDGSPARPVQERCKNSIVVDSGGKTSLGREGILRSVWISGTRGRLAEIVQERASNRKQPVKDESEG
jgi:hypothetical protein